jgi:type IV pilus assembly protein PilM
MASMVGLDIGTTAVRVVEVAGVDASGFAVVTKIGIASLPEGAISGGRIKQPDQVAIAVVRALKEAGLSRYGLVVGTAHPDLAVAKMLIPASILREERLSAVRSLGRSIAPTFTLEESDLSSSLVSVEQSAEGIPTATVDIVAVLSTELEQIRTVCKLARLAPRAVDLTGAALLRSLTRANPAYGEIGTVVDLGASKVTIATRQGLHLRSLRTALGGGYDLTRAITAITGESFEDAEQKKYGMRLIAPTARATSSYVDDEFGARDTSPIDDALSGAVDLLVDTVAQSIESDAANHGSYTQGVTLCGGTALLRGLKDRLQSRVGVPVAIGRPWAEIERSKRNAAYFRDGMTDPRVLLSIAPAVGLALWRDPV